MQSYLCSFLDFHDRISGQGGCRKPAQRPDPSPQGWRSKPQPQAVGCLLSYSMMKFVFAEDSLRRPRTAQKDLNIVMFLVSPIADTVRRLNPFL